MSSSSDANICIVIQSAPTADLEAAELILALGAFDIAVNVIFMGTGLYWLIAQEPRKTNGKAPLKVLRAFPMYGISTLHYSASDLTNTGLSADGLPENAKPLDTRALQALLQNATQCLTF